MILLLGLIIITSGCAEELDSGDEELPNRGLVLDDFRITDDTLRPNQQAIITASFTNYHREIQINEMEIFNEGNLDVDNRRCTPDKDDLEGARDGVTPSIECNWDVEAPGPDTLEGFRERSEPVKLRASYNATLTNQNPLNVEFRSLENIESTQRTSQSFSNGEMEASVTTETPVARDAGNIVEIQASGTGNGRLRGGYLIEYTPEEIFSEECPGKEERITPISGTQISEICEASSGSTGTRNLFFTIHYKYIKEPNLDITVVNRG